MTAQEMAAETTLVYDNYVEVLETGSVEALQHYARPVRADHSPRSRDPRGRGHRAVACDVLARSLFEKYRHDPELLNRILDAYEPAANRIANTVAVSFVEERERIIIRQQQDALRAVYPGAPGPGAPPDPADHRRPGGERARQLTEQPLLGIRAHRAKVVVIDITGAPEVDATVANHSVQTVDASRLMGANVIITGLSPRIAQTLVTIGVDLSKMYTIGDLQVAWRRPSGLLGYTVTKQEVPPPSGTRSSTRLDPAPGAPPRRVHPHRARRHPDGAVPPRLHRRHRPPAGPRRDHRRRRPRRAGLLGSRTLHDIAEMARLRGARTVIVGIQPDVAFAMVRLGMGTGTIPTALDLEEGLAFLNGATVVPGNFGG